MNFLIRWYEEWREVRRCESCDTLREQLAIANADRQFLLKSLVQPVQASNEVRSTELPQPILPKTLPWRVRREMLEVNDREKAEVLRKKELEVAAAKQTTEQLEKELGIEHASEIS